MMVVVYRLANITGKTADAAETVIPALQQLVLVSRIQLHQ
jgi:hypothetical protein